VKVACVQVVSDVVGGWDYVTSLVNIQAPAQPGKVWTGVLSSGSAGRPRSHFTGGMSNPAQERFQAEIDALRAESVSFAGDNATLRAANASFATEVERLIRRIDELTQRVGKSSKNTSMPPSSDSSLNLAPQSTHGEYATTIQAAIQRFTMPHVLEVF